MFDGSCMNGDVHVQLTALAECEKHEDIYVKVNPL